MLLISHYSLFFNLQECISQQKATKNTVGNNIRLLYWAHTCTYKCNTGLGPVWSWRQEWSKFDIEKCSGSIQSLPNAIMFHFLTTNQNVSWMKALCSSSISLLWSIQRSDEMSSNRKTKMRVWKADWWYIHVYNYSGKHPIHFWVPHITYLPLSLTFIVSCVLTIYFEL